MHRLAVHFDAGNQFHRVSHVFLPVARRAGGSARVHEFTRPTICLKSGEREFALPHQLPCDVLPVGLRTRRWSQFAGCLSLLSAPEAFLGAAVRGPEVGAFAHGSAWLL